MSLAPLMRELRRTLARALLKRVIAWGAWAVIGLVATACLSLWLPEIQVVRLGALLAALSLLPAFLLWPLPERRILERLRQLDEEMVFEAFLEAEPGPVRELLRSRAGSRAAALSFVNPPREAWTTGLPRLGLAVLLVLALGEGLSLLVKGRSLVLAPGSEAGPSRGERIEEQGFSDFATEDPAARRARREQALERAEEAMDRAGAGRSESGGRAAASSRRAPQAFDEPGEMPEAPASPSAQREPPPSGPAGSAQRSPSPAPSGKGGGRDEASTTTMNQTGTPRTSPGAEGSRPSPGRSGQGYEHTGDTRVPSPLLDYRARFESRFAERTGQHLAASGRMSLGELRAYQRRYFESFALRVDVGPGDDPYVTLLKKRWADVMEDD